MPNDFIREEIKKSGVISFARFMELALYCPETGYYERNQDNVGRAGDFITSVSVGSLYGELLAAQFAAWLTELQANQHPICIIEAGAHDGKLAADILHWLQNNRPNLYAGIEYWILEPSHTRRIWQEKKLSRFMPQVKWVDGFESLQSDFPSSHIKGIIFSNELLDAFPVRRFGWEASVKKWFEYGVTLADGHFVWAELATPNESLPSSISNLPASLLDVLPDGYVLEDSPAAVNWWSAAAKILHQGKLVAVDYGLTAEELISPARLKGTLRAYYRHQVSDNLLAHPGEQDLTAHVNFSAVQVAGEQAGLKTELLCSQPQFLTGILSRSLKDASFAALDAKQIRQFQTLTHPEHLGRAFRVLVQSR